MDQSEMIMDEINKLSLKIDAVPMVIRSEIRAAAISFGLDPDHPTETQELLYFIRRQKRDSDQIQRKKIDVYCGFIFKGVVALILCGALAVYSQNLISTSIKKELGIIDQRRHYSVGIEKKGVE